MVISVVRRVSASSKTRANSEVICVTLVLLYDNSGFLELDLTLALLVAHCVCVRGRSRILQPPRGAPWKPGTSLSRANATRIFTAREVPLCISYCTVIVSH